MQELILFPNYKARNNYLKDKFKVYTLDITDYQILHRYYKSSRERFFENYKIENQKEYIDESIAIINIHNVLNTYKLENKDSLIAKHNITYELAYNLYKLIEETTLAKFYDFKFDSYDNLKEINDIIKKYKEYNRENNFLDEFDIFELFIDAIKNRELEYLSKYDKITIYGFEKIPPLHLIFLESLKKYYTIDVKVVMPYDMKKYFPNYKSFYQGIDNFEMNYNSDFSQYLLDKDNLFTYSDESVYKDSIKFIAGFGAKQEVDTVVDEVIKLINNGVALYDIGIIFSDIQKYSDIVSNRLNECNIKFNERRANFIWRIPIIPILTSIFLILDKYNGELDVDALIKVISSPYIKNLKGINPYNIRDLIYAYDKYDEFNNVEIYSKMSLSDFKYKIAKKFNNNEASNSIIEFLDLLNILVSKKSYKEIGLAYINILKFLDIGNISDLYEDEKYHHRDNEALALFINLILQISNTEEIEAIKEEEITHFDFHTALNVLLRDKSLMDEVDNGVFITVSNLYDARGLRFKYLFMLGMNNDFINRRPNGFFISNKLRENINKDVKKIAFNTQHYLSDISYALFLNILSYCYEDSKVYFSFRLKDERGNLELPFYYLEDLYNKLYSDDFKFESLKENGLIYRKEYIQNADNIHTKKENMMSLFLYDDVGAEVDDLEGIIEKVYHKRNKVGYSDFVEDSEEIKSFFINKFKEAISVTDLQRVMECPAKYFYSNLYSKNSVEARIQGISYMDKGTTYHSFLQNFYNKVKKTSKTNDCSLKESEFNTYCNIANEVIEEHVNRLVTLYSKKDLEDKYFLEYKLDQNIIKEEAMNAMYYFIQKEIILNKENDEKGYHYIPASFEEPIGIYKNNQNNKNDSIVYKNGDICIKIKGKIDRIDFSYSDSEYKNINGVRIVDYKANYIDEPKQDDIKEIITTYLQPILYLKLILDKYIKNDIADKIKHCEVVFTAYNEKTLINSIKADIKKSSKKDNKKYGSDRDFLLSVCGYIDSEYNLYNYFDEVFTKILDGELLRIPSETACADCYDAKYCPKVYKKDE
ncbi:PD-(D/E)XK nuclease family protein [Brachyspira pulli]|uniref:PD-(D/E)XK nuclease family protein n=1 Tax=Brachyspira pulli TaxID=310721 RepID=UPI0030051285